jgi:uncharacterized metal-binding protein YceD (DUF177 family)
VLVALDDIPTRGLDVVLGPWAVAACAKGIEGTEAQCAGQLHVSRHDRHILVQGALTASALVQCDRCGEPLRLPLEAELTCLYSPLDAVPERGEEEDEGGLPLPEGVPVEACELAEYDGVRLDLAEVVRETCVVERPARVRCVDILGPEADAACIARWQQLSHQTPADEVDPRLAALSNFRPK